MKHRMIALVAVIALICVRWWVVEVPDFLGENEARDVVVEGCVCEEPDVRRNGIKLTVCSEEVGRVLVSVLRYPQWEYGDCVKISGELQRPKDFETFSYSNYLRRYGIYHVMYHPYVEKTGARLTLGGFYRYLFRFKRVFERTLQEVLPEPAASLADGLLLGVRTGMPPSLADAFQQVGLTHIVAISGYNITLVIIFMNGLLGFMPRRARIIAAVVGIFIFSVLVGASAAVVRAAIMGSIGLAALWYGRTSQVLITIFASALLMALWNPYIPLYDVGFQLSFAATLGLVYISPHCMRWFSRVPDFFGLRESLALTVSAQIAASPVILWHFGRISLISPFANMVVLPFIPLAMLFSFSAVLIALISKTLALFIGMYAWLFLMAIIWLTQLFAYISP